MEDIQIKSAQTKKDLSSLMENMVSFTKQYPKAELQDPSNEFVIARDFLNKGEFNLAVCGKVKNGKSSLINALIGRELLPVCTDVATSRVFKISNAEKDSFFIVYANGDKKEITFDKLSSLGNQSIIDKDGDFEADKVIAYIQVYTPLDFLPEGVSLIDTPGIGSTYPQHTAITKQFIKMADGVLFVTNPSPLENIEIDFLKEIIKITPGIIFVTTKIDENGNQSVDEAISRNVVLIKKAIGDSLIFGIDMQKMSSKLLLEAALTDDKDSAEFNYSVSGFDDVKKQILKIVFLTQGYYRIGIAYNYAAAYYDVIYKSLKKRVEDVETATTRYDELKCKYENARSSFLEKMSENRRKEVFGQIETVLKAMESDFNQIFSSKGSLAQKYEDEIDNLTSDSVPEYSNKIGENLMSEIQGKWDNLTQIVQSKLSNILLNFNEECRMAIPEDVDIAITNDDSTPNVGGLTMHDRMTGIRSEMLMGTALTGAVGTLVGSAYFFWPAVVAPALPVVAPIMVVLGVGVILWGAISGNKKAAAQRLEKNKGALKKYVQDTISSCRKQLVETSLADDKYQSLYQGFVIAVRDQAKEGVNSTYNRYKKELDGMAKNLESSKADPKWAAAIKYLYQEWMKNEAKLQSIHSFLESIKTK